MIFCKFPELVEAIVSADRVARATVVESNKLVVLRIFPEIVFIRGRRLIVVLELVLTENDLAISIVFDALDGA